MAFVRVVKGPDSGRRYAVEAEVVRIGRHSDNDLVLTDPTVSRRHAEILKQGDQYLLFDLGSRLGTYVNGVRAEEGQVLRSGDRIRLGNTELVFLAEATRPSAPPGGDETLVPAGLAESKPWTAPDGTSSVLLSIPSEQRVDEVGLSKHLVETLSRVAEALQSITELDELLARILDFVFEIFRPERGVILLCDPADGRLVEQVRRPVDQDFVISRTIVNHAVETRSTVLVPNASQDERFGQAGSVVSEMIQAAICAPMLLYGRLLGVIYVDTRINPMAFRSEELALLNLMAANAAMAVDHALLLREKVERTRLSAEKIEPVVAESPAMKAAVQTLERLAHRPGLTLVCGEPGTGKLFLAQVLHTRSEGADSPFLVVDCAELTAEQAQQVLFGQRPDDGAASLPRTAQHRRHGAFQKARGGTLVLRHVESLESGVQLRLAQLLDQPDARGTEGPRRVVLTAWERPEALRKSGSLVQPLADRLSERVLEVPALRERREDLLPLARLFLSLARQPGSAARLDPSAERLLLRLRFRQQNVAELRRAVELAAGLAEGGAVRAEHIFVGPQGAGPRTELDLSKWRVVRWWTAGRLATVARASVLLVFAVIAGLCLLRPATLAGQLANQLVWGLWWPLLVFLFLFAGRVWCTVCPLSEAGRLAAGAVSLGRPPPQWVKQHSGWLLAGLLAAIVYSEHVFDMVNEPRATGWLLVTLAAGAAGLSVLFARQVWCRYVCPLGGLSATYALAAPVYVHADPASCAQPCETECYRGNGAPGCPVFQHPLYVRDSPHCKLCLTCLSACPNGSARLFLRAPLVDVWRLEDVTETLTPTALTLFCLVPVLLASKTVLHARWAFTVATVVALAAAVGLYWLLRKWGSHDRDPALPSRFAAVAAVLAWGPLACFHLSQVPALRSLAVQVVGRGAAGAPTSLLTVVQVLLLVAAFVLALVTLVGLRLACRRRGLRLPPALWELTSLVFVAYTAVTVWLVVGT